MHLCCHCRSPLPLLQFSIPTAFMARKILGYPFCLVSNAAVRADGKPGGSQSLPSPCSPKNDAEATFALSCGHNCWDHNPMTSKALFQSFHSSFMHSVHCILFLIRIILLFGDAGHLCISLSNCHCAVWLVLSIGPSSFSGIFFLPLNGCFFFFSLFFFLSWDVESERWRNVNEINISLGTSKLPVFWALKLNMAYLVVRPTWKCYLQ